MWRRFHFHSRGDAMTVNSSPGSPYGGADSSKNIEANDKVVFVALGAFFGIMFLLFGIQIYVRCIWRRIENEAMELEEESEEMSRTEIYIREIGTGRRNWRRRLNHYFDERSDSSSPAQRAPIGLDKSVLELLPTFIFSMDAASRDEMVCAVCLEEFADGERGRLLPICRHSFHVQCIDMWFLSHGSCPLCRCEVTLPFPETGSSDLLHNNQNCPDFSADRSEPQPSAPPSLECPPVSSSITDAESASIVGARDSDNVLYLERGSSLSRRAAAVALEISDHECISVAEEDPSTPAVGSPRRLFEENTTTVASSVSIGSPRHARKRSYSAVEIIGEYQLDPSGTVSRIDSSSIHEVRLPPA